MCALHGDEYRWASRVLQMTPTRAAGKILEKKKTYRQRPLTSLCLMKPVRSQSTMKQLYKLSQLSLTKVKKSPPNHQNCRGHLSRARSLNPLPRFAVQWGGGGAVHALIPASSYVAGSAPKKILRRNHIPRKSVNCRLDHDANSTQYAYHPNDREDTEETTRCSPLWEIHVASSLQR